MSLKDKIEKLKPELKKALGVKNNNALPRLVKVVVSSGTGKAKDKKRNELVADRLSKITGQKAALRGAKQSIATFKLRQGDIIGVASTLRGPRMYKFLDKLFNIAMPRMRDFKGYTETSIDDMGNLTIGIREHIVFPETTDEEIKDVFGMSVTIVTTATDKKQALEFFKQIGFPFKKALA
ncbi:MAG: 50S ribosomal protein L5 [Candidatus Vogelbacteria bacterium RIFOXYD1_FULL_44_32]|uniref:Large ribosomal subunit protein uL5 n=1 Tax=Candidatus Vogelbacteria bacterium RIFOXYD1_FULL_44_32 TaxID=1802438 RepID=A0A1G2QEG2_9BACT|nr:MAG: 50S ribosomal protein L5 [Candidatus Vogelbacteria bacterium RIFOXYD1_FULL_44_32]